VVVKTRRAKARQVIVPIVLAVGIVSTAMAVATTSAGCGDDDGPRSDAGTRDAMPDTPIL
jgi:hypothetical protein